MVTRKENHDNCGGAIPRYTLTFAYNKVIILGKEVSLMANITMGVSVDRATEDKLIEVSKKTGKSLSSIIREAITLYLQKVK